jgi:DNA-binding transcriptional ArsR family regulator
MIENATLAQMGALIGDPARASMLVALIDGRALTAKELADRAGITPQTASGHLAKLVARGVLTMRQQGRHRYHVIASAAVAGMIEGMMQAAAVTVPTNGAPPPTFGPRDLALRAARTCYDHLAGRLGVALADAMTGRGHLELDADGGRLTDEGRAFLVELGIDIEAMARSRRGFCRPCLDWSERRFHLAGSVGAALLQRSLRLRWLRPLPDTRALAVTVQGHEGFRRFFGVSTPAPPAARTSALRSR